MPQHDSVKPATAGEVVSIVGQLDDVVITSITATGATAAEVLEAFTWLTADDDLGTELERTRTGRVGQVYGILADEMQQDEER